MNQLTTLLRFFSTGTAEAEENILDQAFVGPKNYFEIFNPPYASPRLLVGRKGSGKSAILRFFRQKSKAAGAPVVLLTPKDLPIQASSQPTALGPLTASAYDVLLRSMACTVAEQHKGLLTGDEALLNKLAREEGKLPHDLVQKTLKFLAPLGQLASGIDFSAFAPQGEKYSNVEVQKALSSTLEKEEKYAYLLIDDTDQVAAPSQPGHLNRVWAFLLACRHLSQELPMLRCILSLRTEIWRRLEKDEAAQRDQTDHFRPLVHRLNHSELDVSQIVERRLKLAAQVEGVRQAETPYSPFFEGRLVRLPGSQEMRNWEHIVIKRSRKRPRDAIQLVNKLATQAKARSRSMISEEGFHAVMPEFSDERVDDLATEVEDECPQIKEVIRTFWEPDYDCGSFTLNADSVLTHLKKVPSRFSLQLHGHQMRPEDRDHAFRLWKFLFEIDFLNARVSDDQERKKYRHLSPDDDPGLVSTARWADIQAVLWEITPAYRDHLIGIQRERMSRVGLPKHDRGRKRGRR
jgi:hypothetical protein